MRHTVCTSVSVKKTNCLTGRSCTSIVRVIQEPEKQVQCSVSPPCEGATRWYHTSFSTSWCCWVCSGSAACCMLLGPAGTPQTSRGSPSLSHHPPSPPLPPTPFPAPPPHPI